MTARQKAILENEIESALKLAEVYAASGKAFLAIGNRSKEIERHHLAAGQARKAQLLTAQLKAQA